MRYTLILTALGMLTGAAFAASTPSLGGPMSHLLVTLHQQQLYISFESPSLSTVIMHDNDGDFTGPASVLNGSGYNAQFGWMANGFISLPPSTGIFVRTLSTSPHLRVYQQSSFQPILGTDASSDTWQWDGTMTHNWYATTIHGPHLARYQLFVGDLWGNPLDTFTPATVDLHFLYGPDLRPRVIAFTGHGANPIPAPGALCPLALGSIGLTRRRR